MNSLVKLILVLAVTGYAGYHFWQQHEKHEAILASADNHGFLPIPRGNGVNPNRVIILAARNCPRADARRARALARALADRHIPHAMWNQIHFNFSPADAPKIPALNMVMNGTVPIVLIHDRGEANPSLEQVVAEFNQGNDDAVAGD